MKKWKQFFLMLVGDLVPLEAKSENEEKDQKPNTSDEADTREHLFKLFSFPAQAEKTILFGFLMCLHSICSVFVAIPLLILSDLKSFVFRKKLNPQLFYHLCEFFSFLLCIFAIFLIDTGKMYHYIRGQSFVKVYVVYNLLELLLKLAAAFNQDVLYAFRYNILAKDRDFSVGFSLFLLNFIASIVHSLLFLVQITTLNVTVNSDNLALLTLLISNNLTEFKSIVLKCLQPENAFQVTTIDSVEFCQLFIFLLTIFMNNLGYLRWNVIENFDVVCRLLWSIGVVLGIEVIVDTAKHFFVSKFNSFKHDLYHQFRLVFCHDILKSQSNGSLLSMTDRFGFVPVPLCAVMFRLSVSSLFSFGLSATQVMTILGFALLALLVLLLLIRCLLFIVVSSVTNNTCNIPLTDELKSLLATQRFKMAKGRVPG